MGVRLSSVVSLTAANVLPANATETVICVTPSIVSTQDNQVLLLFWFVNITVGTGTTSLAFRLRRDGVITGGTFQASAWATAVTAGQQVNLSGWYPDVTPGAIGPRPYALTVVQTGATAAGTINDIALAAIAL